MPKYITITSNPCFDRTIQIGDFVFDNPNRVKSELLQSSGKGINLSLVFAAHGLETISLLLAGRDNYGQYASLLPKEIYLCPILVNGAIRENMTICSSDDKIIKLNRAGAAYTEQAHAEMLQRLSQSVYPGDYCIFSGSLPPA